MTHLSHSIFIRNVSNHTSLNPLEKITFYVLLNDITDKYEEQISTNITRTANLTLDTFIA